MLRRQQADQPMRRIRSPQARRCAGCIVHLERGESFAPGLAPAGSAVIAIPTQALRGRAWPSPCSARAC
jgi:hypothetical protein